MYIDCTSDNTTYIEPNEGINIYYKDVRKYPLLSPSEQRALIADAQQTEDIIKREKAIEKLVCCNQRFVISVAKKLGKTFNHLDLVSEGNIGLMEAIEHFNLDKANHFITYAVWWIMRRMKEYIYNKQGIVYRNEKVRNGFKTVNVEVGSTSTMAFSPSKWVVSIDEPYNIYSDNSNTLEDSYEFTSATATNNIVVDLEEKERNSILESLMDRLTVKEKYIIRNVFGFDGVKMSFSDLAKEQNCSATYIKNIMVRAISKMKQRAGAV